jgi:hypothetical protein
LLGEAPLEERGDAAGVLDHLEAALHLPLRVREHLSVFGREDEGEVLQAVVDELADRKHQLLPA